MDRYGSLPHTVAQREVPMRDTSSIKFKIPVPWSATPVCIAARGRYAVVVAGVIAIIFFLILTIS